MTDLIARVQSLSKQSPRRFIALVHALDKIKRDGVPGDIVECGVWRGASIIIARLICPDRVCWAYDTFDGMTEPTADDVSKLNISAVHKYQSKTAAGRKWNACSLEQFIENLKTFSVLDMSKLRFIVGDVYVTLATQRPQRIALLRLDTDWYLGTLAELQALWPLLEPGGVLIVDDYGHWRGARMAVNQYFGLQPWDGLHLDKFTQIDDTAVMKIKDAADT